jgi:hypothetical protein
MKNESWKKNFGIIEKILKLSVVELEKCRMFLLRENLILIIIFLP